MHAHLAARLRAALAGVLAAGFGITVGQLVAAVTRPAAGPLVAVGGAVIDATPTTVKEFAVRELGTNDKPALLTGIAVVLGLLAALIGVLGSRWRPAVPAGSCVLAVIGAVAAWSRPDASWFDAIPAVLAAALAGVTLRWLLTRTPLARTTGVHVDRRRFLRAAALVATGAVVAQGGAEAIGQARRRGAARTRQAIRLPAPADPAPPLPAQIAPGFVTGNLYRVDTALTVPRIDPHTWRLRIHGMVDREITFSFADLLKQPLIERYITLNCVSNEVGGPYVGTPRWLGVPLGPLLHSARIKDGADQILARSVDGMSIGTPLATALDGRDTILAVGMNGEPLPLEHGFPVRMLTPGLYGYAGACKWLTDIEITRFVDTTAYWVARGWAREGTVKTASRIDRPAPFARLAAGNVTVAGVAWAQRRGIAAVEVSIDGSAWRHAELQPTPSIDTWVQWRYIWHATPGPHSIAVRATDTAGAVQPQTRATPFPDGATGWHTTTVTVAP